MNDLQPITDCHGHVLRGWLNNDAARLRAALRHCARYNVSAVVSVDCAQGEPELDLDLLCRLFGEHGVRLGVTLGFEPPATEQDMATLERRLEAATAVAARLASRDEVVGIGEVGLDHHWPEELILKKGEGKEEIHRQCLEAQVRVFEHWIQQAHELGLPLVVHERRAHQLARQVLDRSVLEPQRVMFHCFGSTADDAADAAARGYIISIPSSVVFRQPYPEVAAAVPLAQLMVETDAPYHSPFKGLWQKHFRQATAAVEAEGLTGKAREREIQRLRSELFFDGAEAAFPGLTFEVWRDGQLQHVPAREHLRTSKARYRNEPTFVRYAALEVAAVRGIEVRETLATLEQNALRFYGFQGQAKV